jgi:hypothetical protein
MEEGEIGVDIVGEVSVGVELQDWEMDGGWSSASLAWAFIPLRPWHLLYCFRRPGVFR